MINSLLKFGVGVLWVAVVMGMSANLYAGAHPDIRIRISQNDTADGETVFQGGLEHVDIVFDGGNAKVGGFDLMISYNREELALADVSAGSILTENDWEFFDFRFGPTNHPEGSVRIVGLANFHDGSEHSAPRALSPKSTFATLTFLINNDRQLACSFLPVRWLWHDCEDNRLVNHASDTFFISNQVFDYAGSDSETPDTDFRRELTGQDSSFPTITGAPLECDSVRRRDVFVRRVEFYNGGFQLTCPGEIDDRGDLNLNGISYEMADLELFIEYFLSGIQGFIGLDPESVIEQSEVNGDGIPLSLADLVYFIRKVLDEAVPLSELTHDRDTVTLKQTNEAIFSDLTLGALFLEFEGNPDVQLLDSTMEMRTGLLDGRKRVLIFNIGPASLAPGRILLTEGKILSAQASDFIGSRVAVEFDFTTDVTADESALLPDKFQLHQNYPNPFNPTTTIEFALPERGAVELIIYNTLGRKVRSLASGMYSAGKYSVSWDGTDNYGRQVTSGVYYYRLSAGDVIQSRKMVLLK